MPVGCPEHSERKEKACKHCDIGKLVVVFTNCERCDCESVQAFTKPKGKMYSKKSPRFRPNESVNGKFQSDDYVK
jgi:hypothetical protein